MILPKYLISRYQSDYQRNTSSKANGIQVRKVKKFHQSKYYLKALHANTYTRIPTHTNILLPITVCVSLSFQSEEALRPTKPSQLENAATPKRRSGETIYKRVKLWNVYWMKFMCCE